MNTCKLCCRFSGAGEEDQRLRLRAFHSERRRNQRHEHVERKGKNSTFTFTDIMFKMQIIIFWSSGHVSFVMSCLSSLAQVVDGSPIEVTLAKPVDKDSYVRYTRGTGGRGGSLLQTDYTAYTLGQVQYLQSWSRCAQRTQRGLRELMFYMKTSLCKQQNNKCG